MAIVLAALSLLGLGIFGPGIASGIVSGGPQLSAGAAVGTGLAAGGVVALGAGAGRAPAPGGASLAGGAAAASRGGTTLAGCSNTEDRRVGTQCFSPCRSRSSTFPEK